MAKSELGRLLEHLQQLDYMVVGPQVRDAAIVYDEVRSMSDLPRGYSDIQQPGSYRVEHTGHDSYFAFNVGPHSWKQYLFPPRLTVATGRYADQQWEFETPPQPTIKYAFLGMRACELAAIDVQDRVFLGGPFVDPVYKSRRESALFIAVNCTQAAPTCFCTSTNTGPQCDKGFDLALTELSDSFLVEVGSPRGRELLTNLETRDASETKQSEAQQLKQRAVDQISKQLPTEGLRDLLLDNLDHPHWDTVATRCLSCTNCTMVCPTCFCSSVREVSDLSGEQVERVREWDSCFNIELSSMSSGVVRNDRRSRYRQWLTHKLASWQDQFETSGCVGCGRCITWCPVGIDLTEEVAQLRETPNTNRKLAVAPPAKTGCLVPQSHNNEH